jgi:alkanesulfonate monooxygenase SsuD/methylene tetrahydromethanopterin reductase-like flavin-dependent oxidoreductase (luciferase family)
MRFVLMTEPQQGLSYDDQLAIARRAEANGFEAFYRSDHYQSFPGPSGEPTTDAWAVIAGLVVTTVDEMSGGRIEVGVGAGWNDTEHAQLGLPFPSIKERVDLLEDQLAILHGLWGEADGWSFEGHQVRITGAQFHPKPVQGPGRPVTPMGSVRPRIVIGGSGKPRVLRLAARYADEFNLVSARPESFVAATAALDEACVEVGRDPSEITRSAMVGVLVGRTDEEMRGRQTAMMQVFGDEGAEAGAQWLEERRTRWVVGTPGEARECVQRFAAVGVERLMLQDFLPWDLDMVDVMGEALIGQV